VFNFLALINLSSHRILRTLYAVVSDILFMLTVF